MRKIIQTSTKKVSDVIKVRIIDTFHSIILTIDSLRQYGKLIQIVLMKFVQIGYNENSFNYE